MNLLRAVAINDPKDFRNKVDDVYVNESKERATLKKELQDLKELNQRIGECTVHFTAEEMMRLMQEAGIAAGACRETLANWLLIHNPPHGPPHRRTEPRTRVR